MMLQNNRAEKNKHLNKTKWVDSCRCQRGFFFFPGLTLLVSLYLLLCNFNVFPVFSSSFFFLFGKSKAAAVVERYAAELKVHSAK